MRYLRIFLILLFSAIVSRAKTDTTIIIITYKADIQFFASGNQFIDNLGRWLSFVPQNIKTQLTMTDTISKINNKRKHSLALTDTNNVSWLYFTDTGKNISYMQLPELPRVNLHWTAIDIHYMIQYVALTQTLWFSKIVFDKDTLMVFVEPDSSYYEKQKNIDTYCPCIHVIIRTTPTNPTDTIKLVPIRGTADIIVAAKENYLFFPLIHFRTSKTDILIIAKKVETKTLPP